MKPTVSIAVLVLLLAAGCASTPPSVIAYSDLPVGDAARGEVVYTQTSAVVAACTACHQSDGAGAPMMAGYSQVAGTRVAGQTASEYTFYSIVEPYRYLVLGYGNAMPHTYDNRLTPQDIADLTAYLLTQ